MKIKLKAVPAFTMKAIKPVLKFTKEEFCDDLKIFFRSL